MNSSGSLPSNAKESRIPKPVFTRRTSLADSSAKSTESDTQKRTVLRPSHTSLETKASSAAGRSSQSGTESDKVQVTIRLRPLRQELGPHRVKSIGAALFSQLAHVMPLRIAFSCPSSTFTFVCSDREKTRGDQEVWKAVDKQTIGISIGSESKTKYAFDQVFNAEANNKQVSSGSIDFISTGPLRLTKSSMKTFREDVGAAVAQQVLSAPRSVWDTQQVMCQGYESWNGQGPIAR